jgi:hypothetical protein
LVPRVVVAALEELHPMVWFYAFSGSDKVLGPWRMLGYEQIQEKPRMVRVTFDNVTPA